VVFFFRLVAEFNCAADGAFTSSGVAVAKLSGRLVCAGLSPASTACSVQTVGPAYPLIGGQGSSGRGLFPYQQLEQRLRRRILIAARVLTGKIHAARGDRTVAFMINRCAEWSDTGRAAAAIRAPLVCGDRYFWRLLASSTRSPEGGPEVCPIPPL